MTSGSGQPSKATRWITDSASFAAQRRSSRTAAGSPDGRILDWRKPWKKAMAAAKEDMATFGEDRHGFRPGLSFHGLRASVVTQLLKAGCQPKEIALLTGHRSLKMINRYNNPLEDQFKQAMAKRAQFTA